MQIIFCDINKAFIDECEQLIESNKHLLKDYKFELYFGDIRDLKYEYAAYISPSNSYSSMGDGLDYIYNYDMFSGIQQVIMEKISKLETRAALTRSFDDLHRTSSKAMLPIGQAMITELTEYERYETCVLITAPTMIIPMNVVNTDNAYQAFMACLGVLKDRKDIKTLICPGLCTGIGDMSPKQSAEQIFRALNDFVTNH